MSANTATQSSSRPALITFEGEARSGKGTSVHAVYKALQAAGHSVVFIDQGQKFRAVAYQALEQGISLQDESALTEFLANADTKAAVISFITSLTHMSEADIQSLLYTPEIASGSAAVGVNRTAQELLPHLLFEQVAHITQTKSADIILIDGRDIATLAWHIDTIGMADFLLGYYFRCDTAIAARRTEGIFVDMDSMSIDEKLQLLEAITRISDRNRIDALRSVNPMREPANAYPLHTVDFVLDDEAYVTQVALDVLVGKMVSINTSYTQNVQEMLDPVVALTARAVELGRKA